MLRSGGASVHIEADPDVLYDLISDVTRMGDWSPETTGATWLDGSTGPVVGARFKGSNKSGIFRWSTKPVVEVAERGREFTFVTLSPRNRKKLTRWSYKLTASGDGVDVGESWAEVNRVPIMGRLLMNDRREQEMNNGCSETLRRIKEVAEARQR